jgi:Zn-dependent peptidase ImmA (M78 family)/DNA-binding XRE family transcriptional regulator
MKKIFAERFKTARVLNGYSLQDLSDKLDNEITRQALYKYERGEVIPNKEMISKLADLLKVHPDYFSKDTKVQIGQVNFRKFAKLPSKEENKIIETTREYLSNYLEIEEILNIEQDWKNPLEGNNSVRNFEDIENATKNLRIAWKIGQDPIYNVVEFLEDHNIKVISMEADSNFDGLETLVEDKYAVIVYNSTKHNKSDRIRFTLLHELAHLLLDFGDLPENQEEILCHKFAGAMLLPEEIIKKELGDKRSKLSVQELGNIKKQYGISMQAIVLRAQDLGIININTSKQFFYFIKQVGWKIDEPIQYNYQGEEKSNRFEQLVFRALAEDMISMSKAASLKNKTISEFRNQYVHM